MSLSIKQNKGMWSELYAFIKLLSDGEIRYIDKEAEDTEFLAKINEVSKGGNTLTIDNESVFSSSSIVVAKRELLANWVLFLYEKIKQGGNRAFTIPEACSYADHLNVNAAGKNAASKGDLSFKILKPETGMFTRPLEVSVKSWLGASPTLFNASKYSTRLIYEVTGVADDVLEGLKDREPRKNLKEIFANNGKVAFLCCAKNTFQRNLELLDSSQTLAFSVLHHFGKNDDEKSSLKEIAVKYGDPIKFKLKMGAFLRASALGMTAVKKWEGDYSASDNYLIVSSDGKLKCLVGRGLLENHLFDVSMIDTPSTSRHEYGNVYKSEGGWRINLNFQIRLHSY